MASLPLSVSHVPCPCPGSCDVCQVMASRPDFQHFVLDPAEPDADEAGD